MVCERCGNTLPEQATVCPFCGTASPKAGTSSPSRDTAIDSGASAQPPTSYGSFPQQIYGDRPIYPQGYMPPSGTPPVAPPPGYLPVQQPSGPMPAYHAAPGPFVRYPQMPMAGNVRLVPKNDSALTIEILFSLVGIFGIGWLMTGETTAGVLLLIASILIYWPIMFAGTVVSDGLALIFFAPLAISIIILNALLLNGLLKRRARRFTMMPPPQAIPPPPRRPLPPQFQ
ncbi:MAG TPA: hypothetical protein VKR06_20520 [Ktedonosporobacter sp.]|nr:hypothetical protein [Ktedonosporobacter sp.]